MKTSLALEHAHTLGSLGRNARADREALRRFQLRKLRVLLANCRSSVAVYRERWRGSDFEPADLATLEDLAVLPTIDKSELRARPVAETLAHHADVRRLARHMTSGSTGEPFTIFRSRREEHLLNFFRMRAWRELGVRRSDRMVALRESSYGVGRGGWPGRLRQALGIYRQEELDPYGPADAALERLAQLRPEIVCGYPSAVAHVAARMQERDQRQVRPRLVLVGGEVLGAEARRTIEDAFAAPLYDVYGAHEFNLLAWQCPASGDYHVCDDNVIVEIVGGDGRPVQPGETGEIIATALHSYTMPFVRYRTGDLAVRGPGPCACGRAWSTLRVIEGRTTYYLRLPGGRRVHPFMITSPLSAREAAWMRQHQIVQISERHVRLNVLPARAPEREELERLQALGESVVGSDVRFEIALVDGFAKHPSGKFHPYISAFDDPERSDVSMAA